MQYKAVIFDLDGTLVNSLDDLADSVNETLTFYGYPAHSVESYKLKVGNGARNLLKLALPPDADDSLIDEALQRYKKIYEDRFLCKTKPYAGILELLKILRQRQIKLAVCTNKHHEAATVIIDTLFPPETFQGVCGEQAGLKRKPAPDVVLQIADKLQVTPDETVYIGDSCVDMQTAVNAGMLPVGVLWGFRQRQELENNGAKVILHQPLELCEKISFI